MKMMQRVIRACFYVYLSVRPSPAHSWTEDALGSEARSGEVALPVKKSPSNEDDSKRMDSDIEGSKTPLSLSPLRRESETTSLESRRYWETSSVEPTWTPPKLATASLSSQIPTASPTVDPFANHVPPANPDPWYFNYDTTSQYGPTLSHATNTGISPLLLAGVQKNHWGYVSNPPHGQNYWTEFTSAHGFGPYKEVLELHHPDNQNMCSIGRLQSPIDVRQSGGEDAVCREEHEVRSLPGDYPIKSGFVEKRIESNKLRLVYQRRPCADLTKSECQEPDPPNADFPNGWGGFADVLHIDFKVPSEHHFEGEQFDGEMQIFHVHPGRRRLAAQSVLIRALDGGYNFYFQEALDAFQEQFDKNAAICAQRQRASNTRRSLASPEPSPFVSFLSWAKQSLGFKKGDGNKLSREGAWDPHHKLLIPSIHFYRYEGSLTEPPCSEMVSWWISDKPMTIGIEQLDQLQKILFTNVDHVTCKKTSTHSNRSVARPICQVNNRQVYKCTARNFGPDP